MTLIQAKQKVEGREPRNRNKPWTTKQGTTPANQTRRQAGGFQSFNEFQLEFSDVSRQRVRRDMVTGPCRLPGSLWHDGAGDACAHDGYDEAWGRIVGVACGCQRWCRIYLSPADLPSLLPGRSAWKSRWCPLILKCFEISQDVLIFFLSFLQPTSGLK